mmetsp:Transcript_32463/g.64360  ORF Transcript_32463/g.64360 Transcript_32463/m.64360 type:complete len:87 (-) Transcript_32463:98-358(-)
MKSRGMLPRVSRRFRDLYSAIVKKKKQKQRQIMTYPTSHCPENSLSSEDALETSLQDEENLDCRGRSRDETISMIAWRRRTDIWRC